MDQLIDGKEGVVYVCVCVWHVRVCVCVSLCVLVGLGVRVCVCVYYVCAEITLSMARGSPPSPVMISSTAAAAGAL